MFGISRSVRSREVQVCTPELFHRAIKGSKVSLICAEIEDALEKLRRGELKKEEYERMKTQLKSQLPILTPSRHLQEWSPPQCRCHPERSLHLRQRPHPQPKRLLGGEAENPRPEVGSRQHLPRACYSIDRRFAFNLQDSQGNDFGRGAEVDVGAARGQ